MIWDEPYEGDDDNEDRGRGRSPTPRARVPERDESASRRPVTFSLAGSGGSGGDDDDRRSRDEERRRRESDQAGRSSGVSDARAPPASGSLSHTGRSSGVPDTRVSSGRGHAVGTGGASGASGARAPPGRNSQRYEDRFCSGGEEDFSSPQRGGDDNGGFPGGRDGRGGSEPPGRDRGRDGRRGGDDGGDRDRDRGRQGSRERQNCRDASGSVDGVEGGGGYSINRVREAQTVKVPAYPSHTTLDQWKVQLCKEIQSASGRNSYAPFRWASTAFLDRFPSSNWETPRGSLGP